jgi:WD40 repeat protein/serine/threonine protein kinase
MSDAPVEIDGSLESLVGQVADEFLRRQRDGEQPQVEEYLIRYPQAADLLRNVLTSLRLLDLSQASAAPAAEAGPREATGTLGDFRIIREIGRGGMGVVYEADQISLSRRVALKVLPFAAALDAKQLQRFKNEAQAAAHLQHTNIVPVYYVGCERGVHFYAMQFIDGQTVAALIGELRRLTESNGANSERSASADHQASAVQPTRPYWPTDKPLTTHHLPVTNAHHSPLTTTPLVAALSTERSNRNPACFRAAANLGIQAAEALEHAHQLGIVHRDIKPANLLVDGRGQLWITDFGLAHIQSQAGLTMSGDLVGTLRYMSPEQALARRVLVDHRTDVYSLGVTLYELLTLQPAFDGRDREELLQQIAFDEPRPPRRLNPPIPAELETIVLKAIGKNPEERYATAQELADDLRRFLEDRPIKARRPTLRQRAAKWRRRHKTVVRAALAVLLMGVTALAVSTVFIWRAKEDVTQANDGLNRANADLREALQRERQNAYYQRIALAEREWSANNLNRMLQLLDECPPDLRGWEWDYLQRLRLKALSPLRHNGAVFCAVFSPDGERIASASHDGHVTIWDARCGRQLFQFRAHDKHVRSVAYSPDGQLLATCSWDQTVKIWKVQILAQDGAASPLHTLTHHGSVWSVVFSPDGQRLASAGDRPAPRGGNFAEVKIWDPIAGQELCTLEGEEREIWSALAFSADGQVLATGHKLDQGGMDDNVVNLWNADTGRKKCTFRGHTQPVVSVAFSPDGRTVASGAGKPFDFVGTDGELKLWDVPTGRELLDRRGHITVFALAFSPDGRRLASAGHDRTIKLWDTATGREVITLRGHFGTVRSLAFSPNGQQLVSASHDMTVRVWDATPVTGETDPAYLTLRGHRGDVTSVAFSPDGRYLTSAGLDGNVKVWDPKTGKEQKPLLGHAGSVLSITFSPDGRWLVSKGSRDRTMKIWDTAAWEVVRTFSHPGGIWTPSVAFSPPDGKLLAVAGIESGDRIISIWDAATGQELHRMRGHTWNISAVAFDRTGQFLASAGADSSVRIWDVRAGKELITLQPRHAGEAMSVAFSPDGNYLASASLDQTVKVWSTATWKLVRTIADAHGGINGVAFASDSRRLAWGGTDATVKVADAATGQILETLRGHTGWVNSVAFSPDGQQIASGSADSTVKVWRAPPVVEPARGNESAQDP